MSEFSKLDKSVQVGYEVIGAKMGQLDGMPESWDENDKPPNLFESFLLALIIGFIPLIIYFLGLTIK